jgi:hypothetical protein
MDEESYIRQIAAMREENECLRAAAHAFGELAERLATQLRQLRAQPEGNGSKATRVRRVSTPDCRLNG